MMQVRVNGEVREMSLIDPDSGVDFEREGIIAAAVTPQNAPGRAI